MMNEVFLGLLLNISLLKSFLWMDLSPDGSVFSLFSGKSKIFFLSLVLCRSKNIGKRRKTETEQITLCKPLKKEGL